MKTTRRRPSRLKLEVQKDIGVFHFNNAAAKRTAIKEGCPPELLVDCISVTNAVKGGLIRRQLVHPVKVLVATHSSPPEIPKAFRDKIVRVPRSEAA